MRLARQVRPAFRLADVIVAILCFILLAGIFWPATVKVRGDDASSQCINNLKQMGLAVHYYASSYNNALPALTSDVAKPKYGACNGGIFLTLLPFIEHDILYQGAITNAPNSSWAAPVPQAPGTPPLQSWPMKIYQCPA